MVPFFLLVILTQQVIILSAETGKELGTNSFFFFMIMASFCHADHVQKEVAEQVAQLKADLGRANA